MSEDLTEKGELIVYQTDDGRVKLDVRLADETVWLTQNMMAELFQTTQQNISLHIRNVFDEAELSPDSTHKKFLSVQPEGTRQVRRDLDYYNLDMIISVGYRVKSLIAKTCIDYVITHELCHLQHHDHGPNFYRLLEKMMPDWARRNTKLELSMV